MKEIELSQGYKALVDDEDYERAVAVGSWHVAKTSRTIYAKHSYKVNGTVHTLMLHRFVLNIKDQRKVDHKDHNGLNCQRHNLRIATTIENGRNRRTNLKSTSGFKGVSFHRGKWEVRIRVGCKYLYLGHFASAVKAARAYDKAAIKYYGRFAQLNLGENK
jgi:AP2 domain